MRKEEAETVLRYDAVDECWHAWSCVPRHINAMKKKGWEHVSQDESGYVKMKAPSHSVKISKAEKPQKRCMSEEEKIDLRKRLTKNADMKKLPEN